MGHNSVHLIVFVGCVLLAGLFAGAETGVYQLSRLRLRLGVENKKVAYLLLIRSLRDSASLLISLLLGTNLSQYFATGSMTYLLLGSVESTHRAVLLATLIGAPVFFVFSELIPKNLFFYRADALMPAVSPALYVFDKAARLCGVTWVLKKLSRVHRHIQKPDAAIHDTSLSTSRGYFETILMETREEGMLSATQAEMVRRLGRISEMPVRMVMTPLAKMRQVSLEASKAELFDVCERYAFSRYPVYEGSSSNIIGFINIYDCLTAEEDFANLRDMVKPIEAIPADTTVTEAIDIMQSARAKMMLVTRGEHGRHAVGIVTMKDLVEELLGELAEW